MLMETGLGHTLQSHLNSLQAMSSWLYTVQACGQVWLACPSFPCHWSRLQGALHQYLCCALPPQDPTPTMFARKHTVMNEQDSKQVFSALPSKGKQDVPGFAPNATIYRKAGSTGSAHVWTQRWGQQRVTLGFYMHHVRACAGGNYRNSTHWTKFCAYQESSFWVSLVIFLTMNHVQALKWEIPSENLKEEKTAFGKQNFKATHNESNSVIIKRKIGS